MAVGQRVDAVQESAPHALALEGRQHQHLGHPQALAVRVAEEVVHRGKPPLHRAHHAQGYQLHTRSTRGQGSDGGAFPVLGMCAVQIATLATGTHQVSPSPQVYFAAAGIPCIGCRNFRGHALNKCQIAHPPLQ